MAVKAKGTTFKIGAVSYKMYKITPPAFERGEVKTTTLDDGYVRKEPGEVIEVKDLEVELEYTDAIQIAIHTELEKTTVSTFIITYPNLKGWTISGFIKSHGVGEVAVGSDTPLSMKISIAVDGEPVPLV